MSGLFEAILGEDDAARATVVVNDLLAHGFHGSLTGSLAIAAHGARAAGAPADDHCATSTSSSRGSRRFPSLLPIGSS